MSMFSLQSNDSQNVCVTYGSGFLLFLGSLVWWSFISNEDGSSGENYSGIDDDGSVSMPTEVLKHRSTVEKYAKE